MMLEKYLEGLTDQRQQGKVKHNLLEIVVMTICAVIAGCDVWEDICDFCRVKEKWFRESIGMKLENGLPSHDTMQRVWAMIDPAEFERCFCAWVESVCRKMPANIVSVDGKTLCGSRDAHKNPIHMVSAWVNEQQMVLGQMAVDEKSNEIAAVPQLLDMLDIAGCIVTSDAMSCQKETAEKIIQKNADYVLALKANQPLTHREAEEYFADVFEKPVDHPSVQTFRSVDSGHGRIETRVYYLSTEIGWYQDKDQWKNLRAFGAVKSKVECDGKISESTRYYLTSVEQISLFANAARKHWGIENSLHWCLDVAFREDDSRIRKDHSAENMAVVRHIALNILKNYPAKISLARKRRRCSYDDAFLADVLASVRA